MNKRISLKPVRSALTLCLLVAIYFGALLPAFGNIITVTNTNDSGAGSLRDAIAGASNGDTIHFSVTGVIVLTSGELLINRSLTISGPGAPSLAISGNNASRVLHLTGGESVIDGLTIRDGNLPGAGAGILIETPMSSSVVTKLTLSNSIVSFNRANGNGGGIRNDGALAVNNSEFRNNDARGGGGGIRNHGLLTVTNSIFSGNTADLGGGMENHGVASVTNSTFVLNSTDVSAAAIYSGPQVSDSWLIVTNSTFRNNTADSVIFCEGGTVLVTFSTFQGNNNPSFPAFGGALRKSLGRIEVKNSIFANGSTAGNCELGNLAPESFLSGGYNLSDDNSCPFSQTGDQNNISVGLDPNGLQSNGGPTPTIALLSSSPALNAIPPASCTDTFGSPVPTDQRGAPRPLGPACDIGAFEQGTTTTVSADAGQYSDVVTLQATVSPFGVSGSVQFLVNGFSIPGTATYDSSTGVATRSYTITLGQGSYTIQANFTSSNSSVTGSTGSNTLSVAREDAVVTADSSNPSSVLVATAGGTSGPFALRANIVEPNDGSPGDSSKAVPVTCTLIPIGPGSPVSATASTTGGGVGGTLTATCSFSNVSVNVYDVVFSTGGDFYTGSGHTVLTVTDPSLGFVTGGGTIINPNTGFPAKFGFVMKFRKNANTQGSLLYVEHRPTGEVVLKSSTVGSLAIVNNQGIVTGKAILNGVGNYTFVMNAIDNGESGTDDLFGLRVNQPNNAAVGNLTFNPVILSRGDIQVPH